MHQAPEEEKKSNKKVRVSLVDEFSLAADPQAALKLSDSVVLVSTHLPIKAIK